MREKKERAEEEKERVMDEMKKLIGNSPPEPL